MKRSLPRKTLLFIAFIIGNLLVSGAAWGQTKTWNGPQNSSGNWSVDNNWSPVGVPTISDQVIIPQDRNVIVNIDNAECKSLHINNATNSSGTSKVIFNLNGRLRVNETVTLGTSGQRKGVIEMVNGGTLICRSIIVNISGTWDPGLGTVELTGTNTLPFSQFNNLILSGGNTTLPGNLNVTGTFTINSGAIFTPNASSIISGGALTGNGTILVTRITATPDFLSQYTIANKILTNLTIDYAGTGNQIINVLGYKALKVSGSGNKTADGNMVLYGTLTLNGGLIEIPAGRTLTLSSPIIEGQPFSSTNHIVTQVNGSDKGVLQVNNIPTTGYTFPVGNGTYYLPVTVKPTLDNSFKVTVFTGITTNGEPGTPVQPEQRKNAVNAVWDVSRINGSGEVSLTLSWPKNQDLEGVGFYTAIPETKGLTHFTNGKWDNPEGTYDGSNNSVTRTGISSFSPFGVAMKGFEVLPVRFSSVKASEKSTGVQIDFTNLTESDVDYYEIERSADGKVYTSVKRLFPAKNDYGSASYTYLDAAAPEGRNVYRIKAVETSGKTVYSSVVSLTLGARNQALQVHAGGGQLSIQISSLPAGTYQFSIYSASGQLLKTESIRHSGGAFSQGMPLNNARSGLYIFRVEGPVHMNTRFVVPQ